MSEIIPELQSLYEVLKASEAGVHMTRINPGKWPQALSIRNAWGGEYNDRMVHIEIDRSDSHKFAYQALSNEGLNDSEKYLTLEEKKGVPGKSLLEIVYRLLAPQS